jgi:hypothetical protein
LALAACLACSILPSPPVASAEREKVVWEFPASGAQTLWAASGRGGEKMDLEVRDGVAGALCDDGDETAWFFEARRSALGDWSNAVGGSLTFRLEHQNPDGDFLLAVYTLRRKP